MAVKLFGFTISRENEEQEEEKLKTFALPNNDDGAVVVQSGSYYGTYVDLDGIVRNEIELITRYRNISQQPEIESAIDDIVNEAVVFEDSGKSVELNVDELEVDVAVKEKIVKEFDTVLKLLNWKNMGHDIFRRWYIDGRLFYHMIIDESSTAKGVQEIRYIDPRRIRKVREVEKTRDTKTGIEIIKTSKEYYLFNERGLAGAHTNLGAKIAIDSVVNINSGLVDSKNAMVLSYLHKSIKPLNQLRMLEDATVIYRLSRAPERRIFYIDVGNMPTIKAEQYLKNIMTNYRNKLVYDANTGEIKDDRRHLSMLEDFWLPRREGGRGTEISTLPGGQNLGEIEDVKFFEKKLYKSLGVPVSRLEPQEGFSLGRTAEVTRDELKFARFVQRLRQKFTGLFDEILKIQLILKRVCTEKEWKHFREQIWYDFKKDNNINELKEAELLSNRIVTLQLVDPYVGRYYSKEWVRKNVLHQTELNIKEIDEQIAQELPNDVLMQQSTGLNPDGTPMSLEQINNGGVQPPPDPEQQQVNPETGQPVDIDPATRQPVQPPSKFEVSMNQLEIAQ